MKLKGKSKILILALVFVMVAGLAACSGSTNSGSTGTATDTPPATGSTVETPPADTTPVETAPVEEEDIAAAPSKDLGGREFRVVTWYGNVPVNDSSLPGAMPDPETSQNYVTDMMFYENMQEIYRDLNCTFSYVTLDWDNTRDMLTTSVMAGDPAGDLFMLDGGWVLNAISSDLIVPYNDYLEADNDLFTAKQYWKPTAEFVGKVWTANQIKAEASGELLAVNMDIIKAIGAESPVDLYERGEWTYEKFMQIAKLATIDTTNDGIIDHYGISGVTDTLVKGFIASNDGVIITDDFNYGYDDPKTMTALDFCYRIFNTDRVFNYDPSIGEDNWDWTRNMYAFREGNIAFGVTPLWQLNPEEITFNYACVPFPKGPDNTGNYPQLFGGFSQGLAIPRGTKNVEDVLLFLERTYHWFGDDFELRDESNQIDLTKNFKTEADATRALDILTAPKKISMDDISINGYSYFWSLGDFPRAFAEGTATPAQKAEELRPWLQGMLEEGFEPFK